MSDKAKGTVYLVGAGPGDLGLMTLRGRELVERAECVVYDALVPRQMLSWCKEGCELVDVGKRAAHHTLPQHEINKLLVECARRHALVVRLKGGDPYIFGRGGEEAQALAEAGVAFEVVPGISSAIAGPAYAGIPVTHRDCCSQLTIFTGHEALSKEAGALDIPGIAAAQGTKIILMGMARLRETLRALVAAGQAGDTPAAAVQWATTARQRSVRATVDTLADAAEAAGLGAPAVVVIGRVVELAPALDWRCRLPLAGRRIVVTRTREQAGELTGALRELGAEVVELPTIRVVPPENRAEFAAAVVDSRHYDWLIFSSPNGVKRFFDAFFSVYEDIRELGGARIAALGPGTAAELKKYGLMADVMPRKAVAEALIAEFDRKAAEVGGVEHMTMLWVHAQQARRTIYDELMKRKAIVDECIAYDVEPAPAEGAQALLEQGVDLITFTSSSTARFFAEMGLVVPEGCRIASMGPVTSATLREYGMPPSVEAELHTIPSLVQAIQTLLAH